MNELEEQNIDNLSMLKATCLKFIYMFRNQIPDQYVAPLVNKVSDFLLSQSPVNQSYSSACVEKLLLRKSQDGQNNFLFTQESLDT